MAIPVRRPGGARPNPTRTAPAAKPEALQIPDGNVREWYSPRQTVSDLSFSMQPGFLSIREVKAAGNTLNRSHH